MNTKKDERHGAVGLVDAAGATAGEAAVAEAGVSRRGFLGGALAGAAGAAIAAGASGAGVAGASEAGGDAIPRAIGHINHLSYVCSGCRTCELICVLTHEGLINPQRSRNIVVKDIQGGDITNVLYCQQCDDPKCLKACPTGALHADEATGARVIDQDVCIGCQTCLNACIYAQGGQGVSRIRYNPETQTCFKCDLCGGEPKCVKYCPIGASQSSWVEYRRIIRPKIDDYVVAVTEGAIEGIAFNRDYSGLQAAKAADTRDWALVATETGAKAVGEVTSSEGGELRIRMHAEFLDASGNLLGSSTERQWCLTMHEYLPIELPFDTADISQIASVTLVANISYWVAGTDEEY